jgi:hypothetical protein
MGSSVKLIGKIGRAAAEQLGIGANLGALRRHVVRRFIEGGADPEFALGAAGRPSRSLEQAGRPSLLGIQIWLLNFHTAFFTGEKNSVSKGFNNGGGAELHRFVSLAED